MKYGVHVALWMARWPEDISPHIRTVKELGFDGVEISLLGMSDEKIDHLRQLTKDLGLEVTCTTGLSPEQDIASNDPEVRDAGLNYLRWGIETAAKLGSELLTGVVYAPWGYFRPSEKTHRTSRSAESLASLTGALAENGMTLGLEAINRFETDLLNTADEACALARQTGSKDIGVLLDAVHMNMEEKDIGAAIRRSADRLVHFHCVENDRGVPGSGHTPWADIFSALRDINYDRWLTIEMFVRAGVEVSPDLNIWRPIETDPTEAARAGLAFLREQIHDRA